jgi:Fe-S-cluster containining protein
MRELFLDIFPNLLSLRFCCTKNISLILIDEILISREVVDKHFICHLEKCKGACCYEGDYGAPLEEEEIAIIQSYLETIKSYLSDDAVRKIEADGFFTSNAFKKQQLETALMEDAACVFMGRNELGITFCGIEKAYLDGKIGFKKPISCHLYPVRVNKNPQTGFEALNYDQWDICQAACALGAENNVRIFEFVKDALIRKYGESFYAELAAAADALEGE